MFFFLNFFILLTFITFLQTTRQRARTVPTGHLLLPPPSTATSQQSTTSPPDYPKPLAGSRDRPRSPMVIA
jgi:hypothetical protein